LDAWFPSKKFEYKAGEFGEVKMMPDGLIVRPPASIAKKLAFLPLGKLTTPKGTAFIIPYVNIKNLRKLEIKPLLGGKRPLIELKFLDEKDILRTLAFAPCKGKLPVKYKTTDFYEELMSKVPGVKKTS